MLAEAGGKTMLLTGDARGDKILKGLELVGLLESRRNDARRRAEGSPSRQRQQPRDRTSSSASPPTTTCSPATASTATRSARRWRCCSTPAATAPFTLHLTYPIDEIDAERKKDWEKEQAKERAKNVKRAAEGKPLKPVREDWSAGMHSLAAFFQSHPLRPGQTLHIVPETDPHVIDLLDVLGF